MMRTTLTIPSWWSVLLKDILETDPDVPESLEAFVPSLERLSSYLNDTASRERRTAPYLRDLRLRHAYLLYFATANLGKLSVPLFELRQSVAFRGKSVLRVLDLGCGPGTGIAGLHAFLGGLSSPPVVELLAVDAVQENIHLAARVGEHARRLTGLPVSVRIAAMNITRPYATWGERFDLVIAMNVLNELPLQHEARWRNGIMEQLTEDGHLLLIEPALRETGRRLLAFRDASIDEGWTVYAPCFRQADCPALERETDWCHHDIPWVRPSFIAWLDERIGNIKKSLKFSYVILNRHGETLSAHLPFTPARRVVSERFDEKGRTWCFVCGSDGRHVCQRNRRDRGPSNEAFDHVERYDILALEDVEQRVHDLRIPPTGAVRILSVSGE
ncbi:MAG: methyltransferase domain-containing protein [Bacteroidetes bacterium]|nr:methyltransferase domain-containing protein [Bacteroidota bacterium]